MPEFRKALLMLFKRRQRQNVTPGFHFQASAIVKLVFHIILFIHLFYFIYLFLQLLADT